MRQSLKMIAMIVLLMLTGAISAFAQASGSTAELRGQIVDSTGAVIPGASITITDVSKGSTRSTITDVDGNYAFIGLLPSNYEIKVSAKGFAASAGKLSLTVGQQANIPFKLTAGPVEVNVEIFAGGEVVDTNRTEQSSTVDAKQISNLPINRRNFLDYALLTPGVTDADNIADASDFRVAQTPQSGLSFGGNNGRGNSVSVDGAETIGASGGVQATLSQEAVQEFQVVRNSYNAEFGGAAGGVVNIVSKSGANSFHGSVFGLFRDQRFDARNFFDYNPNGKSSFNRQQYGGSVLGPIKQDKTFFFTAFERLSQDRTTFVNLLRDPNIFQPTDLQNTLLGFLGANPAFAVPVASARGLLTTTSASFPRTVNLFTNASGQFPFDDNATQFSARLDHNFSDRSNAYLRFNLTDAVAENQAAGALTAVSRGRTVDGFSGGLVGSHNYQFSPTMFNELKLQFSYTRAGFIPNDLNGPEFNIEGRGFFNRDIFLPSRSIDRHFDVYDNVTKISGDHTLKFGGSMFYHRLGSNNETFFGGRFSFSPVIPLVNVLQPALGATGFTAVNSYLRACAGTAIPAYCGAVGPALGADANGNGVADSLDVPMNSIQAFNFGLPAVFQGGFGDPTAFSWTNRYALYLQDAWKVRSNFTLNYGLRYSLHDEPFIIPTYKRDLQPRAGFSWNPRGDGKTVIRGGAGIYTGFLNNAIANVTTELAGTTDPTSIYIVLATPTTNNFGLPRSFDLFSGLSAATGNFSRPIALGDLAGILPATVPAGVTPRPITPGPGQPLEVRFRLGPNYRNPTSYQASLGVQRDLGGGFSLELNYLYVRGLHLSRNRDINQIAQTGLPSLLNPLGGPTYAATNFSLATRFQDNIYEQTANSFYHGFTAQVQRRFSNYFSINAHYTFAKAIDEVTDFNSDFSAQNPLNLRLDRSLSSFDQRHRLVVSGQFQSPFQNTALKDWMFSPIFVGQSGRPFNLLLGFDANADRRSQSDRPGLAGRNSGLGEPFYSFDIRLARRLFVKESRFLEFTFDAFNLLNHTNLAGINNILGAACTTAQGDRFTPCTADATATPRLVDYNLRGRRDRQPTDPLGFTTAADSRQLQFGARFNW
ncbi:MAG: TonB-dependent receptor [Acidobacteria bacterium]|nr:TonB-dependent receptor [Acidobacteriota bacterium]